ncbi:MAG: hypothetical protein FJ290_32540 [Planctomycetes bacterium]|nr:hypothetical protein [Planctomycetota bacterium]
MKRVAVVAAALFLPLFAAPSWTRAAEARLPALPPEPPQPAPEPWEQELRAKLRKPITVEFRDATLEDALASIAKLADVPIRLDPAVDAKARRLTLPKMALSAEHALRWVCRFGLWTFVFRDKAVLIVPRKADAQALSTRVFDIADLLKPPHPREPVAKPDERAGQGWCRYLRHAVAPETWEKQPMGALEPKRPPGAKLDCRNGQLTATNAPPVLDDIEKLLDSHRKTRALQVHVSARHLAIDRSALDTLQVLPREDEAASGGALRAARVTEKQIASILDLVLRHGKGRLLVCPRLTCYNTQRATSAPVVHRSYIRRLDEKGEPEEPEGLAVEVQPFVSADRRFITLVLDVPAQRLRGLDAPRLDAVLTIPDGASVLLDPSLPARADKGDRKLIVLLTAQVVLDIFEEE